MHRLFGIDDFLLLRQAPEVPDALAYVEQRHAHGKVVVTV